MEGVRRAFVDQHAVDLLRHRHLQREVHHVLREVPVALGVNGERGRADAGNRIHRWRSAVKRHGGRQLRHIRHQVPRIGAARAKARHANAIPHDVLVELQVVHAGNQIGAPLHGQRASVGGGQLVGREGRRATLA